MQLQSSRQALQAAAGRLPAHAGVDDRGYVPLRLQPFLQQRHPAFPGMQTVTRA